MPHSPLISIIRCPSPNLKKTRILNRNYVIYVATRKGVDLSPDLPTDTEYDRRLYETNEEIMETSQLKDSAYLKYIHERPKSHGLFGNIDIENIQELGNQMAALTRQGKSIFRGIVSLSEQDAMELGYTNKAKWELYLRSVMPDMMKAQFDIDIQNQCWIAAFHMEGSHPHCHYMFWDKSSKIHNNYIHVSKQHRCRELLSGEMFKEEREAAIISKTTSRDHLLEFGKDINEEISMLLKDTQIRMPIPAKYVELTTIADSLLNFAQNLPSSGRLNYKLLPPELKKDLDQITRQLLQLPSMQKEYNIYIEQNKAATAVYSAGIEKKNAILQKQLSDLNIRLGNQLLKTCKDILKKRDFLAGYSAIPIEEEFLRTLTSMSSPEPDISEDFIDDSYPPAEFYDSDSNLPKNTKYIIEWSKTYKQALSLLYEDANYEEALKLLLKEGSANNVLALHDLGKIYEKGLGVDIDLSISNQYYIKAFDGFTTLLDSSSGNTAYPSHTYLQYRLGRLHENGKGISQDYAKAMEYYNLNDNKYAQYSLGNMYLYGKGTPIDTDKAYYYFNEAAKYKNVAAEYSLAKMCLDDKSNYFNIDKGISILKKIAENDSQLVQHAQYTLGKVYAEYSAEVYPHNLELGVSYFKLAAEQGNEHAQFALGKIYSTRGSSLYDINKAIPYLKDSARQGNSFAQYHLGKIYLENEDIPTDLNAALTYLHLSAAQDNEFALFALGKLYSDKDKPNYNILQSIQYLEKSSALGNTYALAKLGNIYLWGSHSAVPKDTVIGKKYLQEAIAKGNPYAQEILTVYENYHNDIAIRGTFQLFLRCFNSLAQQNRQTKVDAMFQTANYRKLKARQLKGSHEEGKDLE